MELPSLIFNAKGKRLASIIMRRMVRELATSLVFAKSKFGTSPAHRCTASCPECYAPAIIIEHLLPEPRRSHCALLHLCETNKCWNHYIENRIASQSSRPVDSVHFPGNVIVGADSSCYFRARLPMPFDGRKQFPAY